MKDMERVINIYDLVSVIATNTKVVLHDYDNNYKDISDLLKPFSDELKNYYYKTMDANDNTIQIVVTKRKGLAIFDE